MLPSHTCQNGYVFTKAENTSNDEDAKQQELLSCSWECNMAVSWADDLAVLIKPNLV